MKKFKFLEHTADAQFIAYGRTIEEAFENVGLATFEAMLNTDRIDLEEKIEIDLHAQQIEELVYEWLSELIFLFSANNIVFNKFDVNIDRDEDGFKLSGSILGEKIDMEKHKIHTEVKAPTYHGLSVKQNDFFEIKVLLDT
ncbi:Archease SHS2 domain containing protein involved in activation of tRNA ligase RtcB [Methanonatronarchaeum thermophilum]|uniref:Protein archease n=1 Tax=Methanonatronarchaeum thermophilum TaxID=1927129 RepID=A0A1Y3GD09_9EURY|nr:archease [Methanonatronarchaeum thermophilum]OUJ19120.1 Archease SHS2 domain containing protein involved in activation of tRNA ligase RtcB [Methanonatronarchaeum thermophilum]